MAADEWLLRNYRQGAPPTFRFYRWDRLTLSLGRNEDLDEQFDLEWCARNGLSILRRTTGGRAVLHGADVTYSIVGSVQDPQFGGGPVETYEFLARGFFQFFEEIGLQPALQQRRPATSNPSHVCFSEPAAYEILLQGKKIIGNAQRIVSCRRRTPDEPRSRAFLQHGSIPLNDQIPTLSGIFRNATAAQLRREMTSLEATGCLSRYSLRELRDIFLESLAQAYGIQWERRTWTPEELAQIAVLQQEFAPLIGPEVN
jgi:lipoate-protein ligase A